jgi:hypothetical protein
VAAARNSPIVKQVNISPRQGTAKFGVAVTSENSNVSDVAPVRETFNAKR